MIPNAMGPIRWYVDISQVMAWCRQANWIPWHHMASPGANELIMVMGIRKHLSTCIMVVMDICKQFALIYNNCHYNDVIMSPSASQITNFTIVYSTIYSGADHRKHQSSESMAFVRGINRWPVNSPHKWPVTRKMFPFDNVIMVLDIEKNFVLICTAADGNW